MYPFPSLNPISAGEQDLDPEEARPIVDPALKLMIDAVQRYVQRSATFPQADGQVSRLGGRIPRREP